MAREPRLDAPGALHHVMGRGIERAPIFRTDRDRNKPDVVENRQFSSLGRMEEEGDSGWAREFPLETDRLSLEEDCSDWISASHRVFESQCH